MRALLRYLIRRLYKTLQSTSFMQAIEEEFEIQSYTGVSPRNFEYPFGIREIVALNKKKKIEKILDAGSSGSIFPLTLATLGFDVTGVDIILWEIEFPGFNSIVGDLKNLPFKNYSFDAVTAISTMEHVGLARFGEKIDKNGDVKGMKELYRILKRGGYCVLTVPYGTKMIFQNKHRIYDRDAFKNLIGKFRIEKKLFYGSIKDPGVFRPCSEEETYKIFTDKIGGYGVICALLRKV